MKKIKQSEVMEVNRCGGTEDLLLGCPAGPLQKGWFKTMALLPGTDHKDFSWRLGLAFTNVFLGFDKKSVSQGLLGEQAGSRVWAGEV